MAPAARGAGWALTVTAEPAAVTMPDKAKGIARRVDGGLSLKQAMGLLVAGLAIIGVWQLVFGGGSSERPSRRPPWSSITSIWPVRLKPALDPLMTSIAELARELA